MSCGLFIAEGFDLSVMRGSVTSSFSPGRHRREIHKFWLRLIVLLNLEEGYGYSFIYSRISGHPGNARIGLILLVGAARFELTTPCARDIGTYMYRNYMCIMYSIG